MKDVPMSGDFTLSTQVTREKYSAGDYIFFEGDIDFHFYIIEDGRVQIFKKNQMGTRVDIAIIEEGESFGEFALLDKKARSASAQAVSDVVLIKVTEQGYEQLLQELPSWAMSMMRSFITRLKNMNEQLAKQEQFLKK